LFCITKKAGFYFYTTLAVAQRIARFLHTRSRREMWNIAETPLRSLTPEISSNGRTEEDKQETTTTQLEIFFRCRD